MVNNKTCKWVVNRTNPEYVSYISRLASVSPSFAQVLINRGLKTSEQLSSFLNPDISRLSDPREMQGTMTATGRIMEAVKRGERVLIHGDYDADGITATAIMVEGLSGLGLDVRYFIPHRITHGYGFGPAGIEKAREVEAKLIITVDCGITSFEAVSAANSLGIDVIITDHHEPVRGDCPEFTDGAKRSRRIGTVPVKQQTVNGFVLPDALAIINPKIYQASECEIQPPDYDLSGAGVAFKLIQALFDNNIDKVHQLLDLAALGTGADVVPVVGDNRVILSEGIKLVHSGGRLGIRALKEASGIRPDFFKTSFLYYTLIPRINAAGRIADANDVVRLLTTKSPEEASTLAKWLNGLNFKRQEIEELVYRDALNMLDQIGNDHAAVVIAGEGWHPGVVGIVASKIAEKYYKPAFVFSIDNGEAKGSARSIPPFDIYGGLTQCQDILRRFGGHKQAAGLSIGAGDIDRFRDMISDIVRNSLSENDCAPVLNLDATVNISDINIEMVEELARLEPFGHGNEEPLFGARGLEVIQPRIVGKNHLKMHLRQKGRRVDSIGFDFGGLLSTLEDNSLIDAAFSPKINEWDGGRFLQLNLKAIRMTSR